jgi:hypothetical protein
MALQPELIALTGVAAAVLGMVLIVLGVISGALFTPGVVVLLIGSLALAAAGILMVAKRNGPSER